MSIHLCPTAAGETSLIENAPTDTTDHEATRFDTAKMTIWRGE